MGPDRLRWKSGNKVQPYGLWKLGEARELGYVVLVEGPSDCQTLWFHGFPALGLPSASTWKPEWDAFLDGIDRLLVVIEPDAGGEAVKRWICASPLRDRVWLATLPTKDVSELHLDDPEAFPKRLRRALKGATAWSDIAKAKATEAAHQAWAQCQSLAQAPDILVRLVKSLRRSGLVGEERAAKLLFLAVVSRLLDKPVSVAIKGPSSAGKSFLVDVVLRHFPEDAYYALSAMSERALAYSEEPLSHRMLVLYEAAGMTGDFATYLVRSLLSEGCLKYETVEKLADGLRARLIEREGPTGLIVTTTAIKLHPENETRLLSIAVTDSREQTTAVLHALANTSKRTTSYSRWHALQEWLAHQDRDVVVPYAEVLAQNVPPVAVRLRRDFGQLLQLIRAHALLHQASRELDAEGRVVATIADYEAAHSLIADLIAEGLEAGLSPAVREAVLAVEELVCDDGETTVTAVAKYLAIDTSAAWRRIQAAIARGFVRNLQDKRGRPAKLVVGDPLPDDIDILPTPETVCRLASLPQGMEPPSPSPSSSSSLPYFESEGPDRSRLIEVDLRPVNWAEVYEHLLDDAKEPAR